MVFYNVYRQDLTQIHTNKVLIQRQSNIGRGAAKRRVRKGITGFLVRSARRVLGELLMAGLHASRDTQRTGSPLFPAHET